MPSSTFLKSFDNLVSSKTIAELVAKSLMGDEALQKIHLRYADMRDNFGNYTYDDWDKSEQSKVWRFSSGVTPYHDFDDTTNVPIPISKSVIKEISDSAVTSLDLPTWFVPNKTDYRVLLLTQDPMPRSDWYNECRDAVCSSPFGLHSKSWREKGNGGARMWGLVQSLLSHNVAVYLTDIRKFHFRSVGGEYIPPTDSILHLYKEMLMAEVDMITPNLIITFGNQAKSALLELSSEIVSRETLSLPHFSGQAQGKIKSFFGVKNNEIFDVNRQIELYTDTIINNLRHDTAKLQIH